jgi:hypothetical protein
MAITKGSDPMRRVRGLKARVGRLEAAQRRGEPDETFNPRLKRVERDLVALCDEADIEVSPWLREASAS